jgi:UDP:flavonoid glycosyltransferase YjiC (YdhE family)
MRILLSITPSEGPVADAALLVAELVARDHEVVVYSGDRHRERFDSLGAHFVAWQEAEGAGDPGQAEREARDLEALIARGDFDVLAGDASSPGTALAGEATGVPWLTLPAASIASADSIEAAAASIESNN